MTDKEDLKNIHLGLIVDNDENQVSESIELDENACVDEIDKFINDIYDLRRQGLEDTGEYDIKNLVFKEFRSKGYLAKLKDMKDRCISKELSLECLDENFDIKKYNTKSKLNSLKKSATEAGTYSIDDKGNIERVDLDKGYQVSYFRPEITDDEIEDGFNMLSKAMKRHAGKGEHAGEAFLGVFDDEPEISFTVGDIKIAKLLAIVFNQYSIWDNENGHEITNSEFDPKLKVDYEKAFETLKEMLDI